MCSRGRGGKRTKRADDGWGDIGYMAAKVQKLEDQVKADHHQATESDIFKGVSVFVNGYTKPTSSVLKELVLKHGGVFHHYYTRDKVTHILASNLPNSKVLNLTDKKVCKPQWITDSIAAGQLLPYQDYLLYTARSKIQPGLSFERTASSISSSDDTKANQYMEPEEKTEKIQQADSTWEKRADSHGNNCSTMPTSASNEDLFIAINVQEDDPNIDQESDPINLDQTSIKISPNKSISTEKNNHSPAKAGDPTFVAEFYSNSRLHHLSTWGAEFRAYVNKLQQQGDDGFPARNKLRALVDGKPGNGSTSTKNGGSRLSLSKNKVMNGGKLARVIMHIDMDCFFVSVGLRNRPDLIGKPVAVTHSRGKGAASRQGTDLAYEQSHWRRHRTKTNKNSTETDSIEGDFDEVEEVDEDRRNESSVSGGTTINQAFQSMAEIASCSYEARQAGVKNGMFMGKAKTLCPDLITIPYDFEGYNSVSTILYDTIASYTHDIEAVSCDEMMVDCTDVLADTGVAPLQFAALVRDEIQEKTKCTASAGMAPNILLARLATRVAKPNGQHLVLPEDAKEFIKDKSIKDLPGVGWSLSNKLQQLGVVTCGDLQSISLDTLQKELGPKTGQSLYNFCRGIDDRPIKMEKERKSVSAEINYGIRFTQMSEAEKFIKELCEEVSSRLVKVGVKGKTITLKLKVRKKGAPKETAKFMGHGVCDNIAKSVSVAMATDNPKVIAKETLSLLQPMKIPPEDFRGIGIQISRLDTKQKTGDKNAPSILQFTTVVSPSNTLASKKTPPSSSKSPESPHVAPVAFPVTSPTSNMDEISVCLNGEQECQKVDIKNKQLFPTRRSPQLPPLPYLPDPTSPDLSFSELMTEGSTRATQNLTPAAQKRPKPSHDFMLPSPSQVDPSVLSELPAEIREQIEAALGQKADSASSGRSTMISGDRPSGSSGDVVDVHDSQDAGCSHWTGRADIKVIKPGQVNTDQTTLQNTQPIVALPSFSQLDPSCLEALPEDMRQELERAYAEERRKKSASFPSDCVGTLTADPVTNIHPLMRIQKQDSPRKISPKKSPAKSPGRNKKSPLFKVPRGRPPGRKKRLSPKKLEFLHQNRTDEVVLQGTSEVTEITPEKEDYISQPKPISLCGAVTLPEVKDLLKEWISSSDEPEEEDLSQFVDYMCALVQDKNLEMVHLLIKYLYRLVGKDASSSWQPGCVFILQHIQALIKALHGSHLAVPDIWKHITS